MRILEVVVGDIASPDDDAQHRYPNLIVGTIPARVALGYADKSVCRPGRIGQQIVVVERRVVHIAASLLAVSAAR